MGLTVFKQSFFKGRQLWTFFSLLLASALKCWHCRASEHAFCSVDWDPSKVSDQDKSNHYGHCYGDVCMKAILYDGDG